MRAKLFNLSTHQWPDQGLKPGALVRVGESETSNGSPVYRAAGRDLAAPASNDLINNVLLLIERVDDNVG